MPIMQLGDPLPEIEVSTALAARPATATNPVCA